MSTDQPRGPKTSQLRRYRLDPERLDEFVAHWSSSIPQLRAEYGFSIPFAYLDRERAVFTWAVTVNGGRDAFAAAEQSYYRSPQKLAESQAEPDGAPILLGIEVGIVDELTPERTAPHGGPATSAGDAA